MGQGGHRLRAPGGILLQALMDQRRQDDRDLRRQLSQRARWLAQVPLDDLERRQGAQPGRRLAGERLIKHDSDRVDVRAGVGLLAAQQLGRRVERRAAALVGGGLDQSHRVDGGAHARIGEPVALEDHVLLRRERRELGAQRRIPLDGQSLVGRWRWRWWWRRRGGSAGPSEWQRGLLAHGREDLGSQLEAGGA